MDKNELIEIYQDQGFQDKIDILSEKPDGEKVEVYNLDGYYDYFLL